MLTSAVFVQQATDRIRLWFISTCKWNISHDKSSSYSWEVIEVSVFHFDVMKHLLVGSTQLLDIHGVDRDARKIFRTTVFFTTCAYSNAQILCSSYKHLCITAVSKMLTKQHSQQSLCSANAKVGSLCQTQGAQEQQRLLQDLSHGWQVSFSGGVKQHLRKLRKEKCKGEPVWQLCLKIQNLFSDDHQERPTSCVLPPSSHQRWLLLKSCHQYCQHSAISQSSRSLHARFFIPDIH